MLSVPNTDSNSFYLRKCKQFQLERHPARFPEDIPAFFIKFLTDEGDLVLDIFAGSNTTGVAAERLRRRWLAFDSSHEYLRASVLRFVEGDHDRKIEEVLKLLSCAEADLPLEHVSLASLPSGGVRKSKESRTEQLFS